MIPRRKLNNVRQIEIGTNRLVLGKLYPRSFQAPAKICGIARAVENGENRKDILLNCEVNAVFGKATQPNLSGVTTNLPEQTDIRLRPLKSYRDLEGKLSSQPGPLFFIPSDRFLKFTPRRRFENEVEAHFHPNRFFKSACTCSQGIPSRGFLSNSARRRSSSAACSLVKSGSIQPSSSPNSVQICSTTARFSSAFKPRICSMILISVALTRLNYSGLGNFASP
jgi:hypothetical protein